VTNWQNALDAGAEIVGEDFDDGSQLYDPGAGGDRGGAARRG